LWEFSPKKMDSYGYEFKGNRRVWDFLALFWEAYSLSINLSINSVFEGFRHRKFEVIQEEICLTTM